MVSEKLLIIVFIVVIRPGNDTAVGVYKQSLSRNNSIFKQILDQTVELISYIGL